MKAAEKNGDRVAFKHLALMYQKGLHVGVDHAKALQYFEIGAQKGLQDAMEQAGLYRYLPEYGMRDLEKAFKWFSMGVEKKSALCMHHLGLMFMNGEHVARDSSKAAEYFEMAAMKNYAPSIAVLAEIYCGDDALENPGAAVRAYAWYLAFGGRGFPEECLSKIAEIGEDLSPQQRRDAELEAEAINSKLSK